jgi:hypothetical protein
LGILFFSREAPFIASLYSDSINISASAEACNHSMGQQHSRVRRPKLRRKESSNIHEGFQVIGEDDEDVLDEKISLCRKELEAVVAQGVAEQHRQQLELSQIDTELYERKLKLHQSGERAKTFFSFWDYVKIVQNASYRQYQSEEIKKGKRKTTSASSTALMAQSSAITFTVFGFFEAFLVRRLHLALMIQSQCHMQKQGWNDIIGFCSDEILATKRDTEQAKLFLKYIQKKAPTYQNELLETVEHFLFLQDKLMYRLRHGEQSLTGFDYSGGYPIITNSTSHGTPNTECIEPTSEEPNQVEELDSDYSDDFDLDGDSKHEERDIPEPCGNWRIDTEYATSAETLAKEGGTLAHRLVGEKESNGSGSDLDLDLDSDGNCDETNETEVRGKADDTTRRIHGSRNKHAGPPRNIITSKKLAQ